MENYTHHNALRVLAMTNACRVDWVLDFVEHFGQLVVPILCMQALCSPANWERGAKQFRQTRTILGAGASSLIP